jgi:hypothetical protein
MARIVEARDSRVRTERTAEGLRIDVARRRPWWRWGLPAWGLFVVGFGLVSMLATEPPENSGGSWFLVFWAGFGLAFVGVTLWGLLHREHLLLDAGTLRQLRRLGPIKTERRYARERIEDLRVSPESISMVDFRASLRMWGVGGGTVAFDYGDRTYRVADVDEAEAKRVVAALAEEGLGS